MAWTAPRTWTDGELVTAAIMNPHIRDNFNALPHLIVKKPSDESVTSNITPQADDHLILPVGANEIWITEWHILALEGGGNMNYRFSFPSGGQIAFTAHVQEVGGTYTNRSIFGTTSPTSTNSVALSSLPRDVPIQGIYINGGTGGSVTFEWAQQASNAGATTVKANSLLFAGRVA